MRKYLAPGSVNWIEDEEQKQSLLQVPQTDSTGRVKEAPASAAPKPSSPPRKARKYLLWTNGQFFLLFFIFFLVAAVALIGPDYLPPTVCVWGGNDCNYPAGSGLAMRPSYKIEKSLWTSSARQGVILFALVPLVVTLGLKQWPFNIFAIPYGINYHFDKTLNIHRWVGRLIWLWTSIHAATWLRQLYIDKTPFNQRVLDKAPNKYGFIAAIFAYISLSFIIIFSFIHIRSKFYEFFYYSHIILVIGFIATSLAHWPGLYAYLTFALALWFAERLVRFFLWFWVNGIGVTARIRSQMPSHVQLVGVEYTGKELPKYDPTEDEYDESDDLIPAKPSQLEPEPSSSDSDEKKALSKPRRRPNQQSRMLRPVSVFEYGPGQAHARGQDGRLPRNARGHAVTSMIERDDEQFKRMFKERFKRPRPPAGYAFAELLPGQLIRLTVRTIRTVRWKPGQNLLITLPEIERYQSHPFTIANCDVREKTILSYDRFDKGSTLVFLIKIRCGFTRALKDKIHEMRKTDVNGMSSLAPPRSIAFRAMVSIPTGSSGRTKWHKYPTVIIVVGGSGITFGLSALEFLCRSIKARDDAGIMLRDTFFKTVRIRFVWTIKEYAHLAWCARTIIDCTTMVKPDQLQLDLCVTSGQKPTFHRVPRERADAIPEEPEDEEGAEADSERKRPFRRHSVDSRRDSIDSTNSTLVDDDRNPFADSRRNSYDFKKDDYGHKSDHSRSSDFYDDDDPYRHHTLSRVPSRRSSYSSDRYEEDEFHPMEYAMDDDDRWDRNREEEALHNVLKKEGKIRRAHSRMERGIEQPRGSKSKNETKHSRSRSDAPSKPSKSKKQSTASDSSQPSKPQASSSVKRESSYLTSSIVPTDKDFFFDLDEDEQEDLRLVSELAVNSRPNLEKLIDEEIAIATGMILVSTCGPVALNHSLRDIVSARIDPSKVLRGDSRGHLELIAEEFGM
ncbi:hypothetical protein BT69DRAFT_1349620 [Atractiella rhizophila]|nr:hypothetical protein BT69DRAFT_1349620 [Atractiella rhizophila]